MSRGRTVNIHYARTNLSKLLERVEHGEEITIARAGKPVATLTPARPPQRRQLGTLRGQFDFPPAMFSSELDKEIEDDFLNGPVFPDDGAY